MAADIIKTPEKGHNKLSFPFFQVESTKLEWTDATSFLQTHLLAC